MPGLPNDFIVLWELSSSPIRYVKKHDGCWDLMIRSHGKWMLESRVVDLIAARAFHEAESVYAVVDRSQPKAEELPPIPEGIYWRTEAINFYDAHTKRGMGNVFYSNWKHRRAEFPVCDRFENEEKQ